MIDCCLICQSASLFAISPSDFSLFPLTDPSLLLKGQANSAYKGCHSFLCMNHQLPFFTASVKTLVGVVSPAMPIISLVNLTLLLTLLPHISDHNLYPSPDQNSRINFPSQPTATEQSPVLHGLLSYSSTKTVAKC